MQENVAEKLTIVELGAIGEVSRERNVEMSCEIIAGGLGGAM